MIVNKGGEGAAGISFKKNCPKCGGTGLISYGKGDKVVLMRCTCDGGKRWKPKK